MNEASAREAVAQAPLAGDTRAPVAGDARTLVRLLQFGDSALPIGGFAFSNGLESAVQQRVVTDRASLAGFVRTALGQAACGDGVGLVHAHREAVHIDAVRLHAGSAGRELAAPGDDALAALVAIDRLLLARKLSSEARTMSTRMGAKLAQLAAEVTGLALPAAWHARIAAGGAPGSHAVALAVAFAAQGLAAREAFAVHQYALAAGMLSAALRLMRIGHHDTQAILAEVSEDVEAAFQRASRTPLAHMSGFAPLAEIIAAVHVKAHVRLFMN